MSFTYNCTITRADVDGVGRAVGVGKGIAGGCTGIIIIALQEKRVFPILGLIQRLQGSKIGSQTTAAKITQTNLSALQPARPAVFVIV